MVEGYISSERKTVSQFFFFFLGNFKWTNQIKNLFTQGAKPNIGWSSWSDKG